MTKTMFETPTEIVERRDKTKSYENDIDDAFSLYADAEKLAKKLRSLDEGQYVNIVSVAGNGDINERRFTFDKILTDESSSTGSKAVIWAKVWEEGEPPSWRVGVRVSTDGVTGDKVRLELKRYGGRCKNTKWESNERLVGVWPDERPAALQE